MFADADPFWKPPTVYDVLSIAGLLLGVVGLLLSVGSIWLAWYLAKKQLETDLQKAANEALDRVAQMLLGGDLADAARFLREADHMLNEKEWALAQMRLDDTASLIARFASNSKLTVDETKTWTGRVDDLTQLIQHTRAHARSVKNRGHLPPELVEPLRSLIAQLELLRGRLTSQAHRTQVAEKPNG